MSKTYETKNGYTITEYDNVVFIKACQSDTITELSITIVKNGELTVETTISRERIRSIGKLMNSLPAGTVGQLRTAEKGDGRTFLYDFTPMRRVV